MAKNANNKHKGRSTGNDLYAKKNINLEVTSKWNTDELGR